MERMKKILKKLFFLPPVPTLLISVPSYGLVIYVLAGKEVEPAITYPESRIISTQNVRTLEPPVCQEIIGPAQ